MWTRVRDASREVAFRAYSSERSPEVSILDADQNHGLGLAYHT